MLCLGIESTAHTFGIGIVDEKCMILADEKHSVKTEQGGLIPKELEVHHLQQARTVLENALKNAKVKMKDIGLISFAKGPGIGPALRVGAVTARTLSLLHKKPLLPVNHCIAHIEIGKKKTGAKDPVVVYSSGANTQIIGYENNYYRIFGETLDMGIGNLLDSFGRSLGMGFPSGPRLDEMYFEGRNLVELPYTVKGMDLAFSGLLTSARQKIGKVEEKDLIYSLVHNAFSELTEVTERALAHTEKKEVLLVGGVGASKALKEMMEKMCRERNAKLFVPERNVLVDNGVMIAWLGILEFKAKEKYSLEETRIDQGFRTDMQKVSWIKS